MSMAAKASVAVITPPTTMAMAPSRAMPVRSMASPGRRPQAMPRYVREKRMPAVIAVDNPDIR